jgi:hypothetical protein
MENEITGGFTFYGYIPDNSNEQHLGIVLGVKDPWLKYCYCTSKYKKIINEMDFVKIPAVKMQNYFNDAKITYIYLSHQHIIDILLITFKSRLNSEYDIMEPIDNDIFAQILSRIHNSDNLSERFKNEFFAFIE